MATITVRNLDDDTQRRLKLRAAANNRSMEAEARAILSDAVRVDTFASDWILLFEPFRGDFETPEHSTPRVLDWLARQREASITSVTVGELLGGVRMLPRGRRRTDLVAAVEAALEARAGRILGYDAAAARIFAELRESAREAGQALTVEDGMTAAICRQHGVALATRNLR